MKLQALLFLPAILFGVLNKEDLADISNQISSAEGGIRFLKGRMICLNGYMAEWDKRLKNEADQANALEKVVNELKEIEDQQKLTAAQSRLFRNLKSLLQNIGSWEKEYKKGTEKISSDIRNFRMIDKKQFMENCLLALNQPTDDSIKNIEPVSVRFRAMKLNQILDELQPQIEESTIKMENMLPLFKQTEAEAKQMLQRNRIDF